MGMKKNIALLAKRCKKIKQFFFLLKNPAKNDENDTSK